MLSSLPRWSKSWDYSSLTKDEPLVEKSREEDDQILQPRRTSWRRADIFLWMSNLLFASLSFYLYFTLRQQKLHSSSLGSFEKGFTTEMAAVKSEIVPERRMFYGAPSWTKDGVGSLLLDPNERRYVGEANDEIDDNWNDFIGSKY